MARNTYKHHKKLVPLPSTQRSAISNGTLLHDLDHRGAFARRLRDLISDHASDLGGVEQLSSSERLLIRRCAFMTMQLESMEQGFASNGQADAKALDIYGRVTGNLRRTLESLGLKRRQRVVGGGADLVTLAKDIRSNSRRQAGVR